MLVLLTIIAILIVLKIAFKLAWWKTLAGFVTCIAAILLLIAI